MVEVSPLSLGTPSLEQQNQSLNQIVQILGRMTNDFEKSLSSSGKKIVPSGSTNGAPVKITATGTPGTLFHTASASVVDEIWLYLTNTSAAAVQATIEYGDATAPDHNLDIPVPANDTILALPGLVLSGGLTVKAFAASANVINMVGYVMRSPS